MVSRLLFIVNHLGPTAQRYKVGHCPASNQRVVMFSNKGPSKQRLSRRKAPLSATTCTCVYMCVFVHVHDYRGMPGGIIEMHRSLNIARQWLLLNASHTKPWLDAEPTRKRLGLRYVMYTASVSVNTPCRFTDQYEPKSDKVFRALDSGGGRRDGRGGKPEEMGVRANARSTDVAMQMGIIKQRLNPSFSWGHVRQCLVQSTIRHQPGG